MQLKTDYINIFTYIYLLISIFLFCYTFYRAEIIYEGKQFSYYYKYYLIFIIATIFWFFVIFLKRKVFIIVIATSFVFLLYFYETISFFKPSILKLSFMKSINKETLVNSKLGEECKFEVIQNLKRSKNIEVVPSIFPKAFLDNSWSNQEDGSKTLPLGGVSNTTTVFCKEGKEFSIYKSDRYGFNNPDSEWKNNKTFWFLIGDSFVQGSCVQPGQDFARQMRVLTQENVISLGMSGNGPLIELASLKEYSSEKKPKAVLWFYFERNDLEDLKNEKKHSILLRYINEDFSQNLISKQNELDIKLKKYIKLEEEKLINDSLTEKKEYEDFLAFSKIIRLQIIRDKMSLDRGLDFGIDPLFSQILLSAKNLINTWGGKMYFIYLPDKERYANQKIKDDNYLKRSQIIELVNDLNIPLIDIHKDFFMQQDDPISFFAHRIYGHYSSDGYHEISKTIVKKIRD